MSIGRRIAASLMAETPIFGFGLVSIRQRLIESYRASFGTSVAEPNL